jgi:DNA-binding NarL/FixJ family response regulator
MPIRVLLADDHLIVRQGLKDLLQREGFTVIAEASDGREAVRLAREHRPEIAVLDLSMPLLNGLDAAREIQQSCPRTALILLTMHTEDPYIVEAMRAGVKGYVLKTQAAADLVQAIRDVSQGRLYLSPQVSGALAAALVNKSDSQEDPLSPRERQVLQLIAEGQTTKEIASLLGISVKTAESHRSRIMDKLGIHEIAGLVRYAIRRGLVQP